MESLTEPNTGITFPNTIPPSGDVLCGAGARIKKVAMMNIKVYAVGLYVPADQMKQHLSKFAGLSSSELQTNSSGFFQSLLSAPIRKTFLIIMARTVTSTQLMDGLSEQLVPRLAGGPGAPLMEELRKALNQSSEIKQGDKIYLSVHRWSGAGSPPVVVDHSAKDSIVPHSGEGWFHLVAGDTTRLRIQSKELTEALQSIYLDDSPVSPQAKLAFTERIPSILPVTATPLSASPSPRSSRMSTSSIVGSAEIEKEGVLFRYHPKRSGLIQAKWSKRYFRLQNGWLVYRHTKESRVQRGSIHLKGCTVNAEGEQTVYTHVAFGELTCFVFSLLHPVKNLKLRMAALSQQDADGWIMALKESCNRFRNEPASPISNISTKNTVLSWEEEKVVPHKPGAVGGGGGGPDWTMVVVVVITAVLLFEIIPLLFM